MANKIAYLTKEKLVRILQENYTIIPPDCSEISISEYSEGYMNHVFKVEFHITDPDVAPKKYVVILYNSMRYKGQHWYDFITEISRITEYLNSQGFISRRAIKNNLNEFVTNVKLQGDGEDSTTHLLGVYEYLEGKTLVWDGYTRRHLRAVGESMARMHSLLKSYENQQKTLGSLTVSAAIMNWQEYFVHDNERLLGYINENASHILRKLNLEINIHEVGEIVKKIKATTSKPANYQLIHCDFVRGNILFTGKKLVNTYEISGILDFEKTLYGPIQIDLARTLAFLQVDCQYKTPQEIEQYFLNEGYIALGLGKKLKISDLGLYMIYFWLRDFWKFLECNPYEDLKKNYHFNKTVDILLSENILQKVNNSQ